MLCVVTCCAVTLRWADAAGRLQEADLQQRRWEPVGANPSPDGSGDDGDELTSQHQHQHQRPARLVVLTDVSGPLGESPIGERPGVRFRSLSVSG